MNQVVSVKMGQKKLLRSNMHTLNCFRHKNILIYDIDNDVYDVYDVDDIDNVDNVDKVEHVDNVEDVDDFDVDNMMLMMTLTT